MTRTPGAWRGAWAAIGLVGALAGIEVAWGWALVRSEAGAPPGWSREHAPALHDQADTGAQALPNGWVLTHGDALQATETVDDLRVEVFVAPGAALEVWTTPSGPGLTLTGGARARSSGGARCSGDLPPLGDAAYTLHVVRTPEGFRADAGAGVLTCSVPGAPAPLRLQAGAQPVRILTLVADGADPGGHALGIGLLAAIVGGLVAIAASRRERRAGALTLAVTWLPVVAAAPLLGQSPAALAEALRFRALDTPFLAPALGIGGVLALKLVSALTRLSRGADHPAARVVGTLLAGATATAAAAALGGVDAPAGLGGFALAGLAAGLLIVANIRRFPHFNETSLLACLGLVAGLELGARHTATGRAWATAWSWTESTWQQQQPGGAPLATVLHDFASLDAEQHTIFPVGGYPIAPPPRTAPVRIVCLGGSSTGGAGQYNTLDLFYPARLEHRLGPGVQVVNQGVGGWTTFHIRRYVERHLDELDADILTLYVSSNDAGRSLPAPIDELYARWATQRTLDTWAGPLRSLVLYQGLTSLLTGLRDPRNTAGVPLDRFRENVSAILDAAGARAIPVVLIGEVVVPGPPDLPAYHDVLRALAAERDGVSYLDASAALLPEAPVNFLDLVHPSPQGHEVLAAALAAELKKDGLAPRPAP